MSFDPKEGFKIDQLELNDGGFYECSIEQDEISASNTFAVQIVRAEGLKKPHITKTGLEFVTAGSSLHINCSLQMSVGQPYVFHWEPPRKSVSLTTLHYLQPSNRCLIFLISPTLGHQQDTANSFQANITRRQFGDLSIRGGLCDLRRPRRLRVHCSIPKRKNLNQTVHPRSWLIIYLR